MKRIIRNITTVPMSITFRAFHTINQLFPNKETYARVKRDLHETLVVPFLPSYEVIFIMYHVVPGRPLEKQETIYNFEKGESHEAEDFYSRTIQSTMDFKVMPSEVHIKRRNKIIRSEIFGPVKELKAMAQA